MLICYECAGRREEAKMAGMYRVKGQVFFFDDQQTLAALPTGTLIRALENEGETTVLMKWVDQRGKMRSERVPPQLWARYVGNDLDPI
jgi:hypothetical protein